MYIDVGLGRHFRYVPGHLHRPLGSPLQRHVQRGRRRRRLHRQRRRHVYRMEDLGERQLVAAEEVEQETNSGLIPSFAGACSTEEPS